MANARASDRGSIVTGAWPSLSRLVGPGLVIFAVGIRLMVFGSLLYGHRVPDYIDRFSEIAAENGTPYRDFQVEYPPLMLAAIDVIGDADPQTTGTRLLWLGFASDGVIVGSLLWGWGRRAALAYLLLSAPVVGLIYQTMDAFPVALGSAGTALAWKRRERSGGLVLVSALFTKMWSIVLLPGLLVWARRRAAFYAVSALIVGGAAWVVISGPDAPLQVATQRHSPGWQVESTIGSVIWLFGDDEAHSVLDSARVGTAPTWAKILLLTAAAAGITGIWLRARRHPGEIGAPSLATVALLLFFAPIYSYPYVLWLLPWAAIAYVEGRTLLIYMVLTVILLTLVAYAMLGGGIVEASPAVQITLVARNIFTGLIPIVYLARQARWLAAGGGLCPPDYA